MTTTICAHNYTPPAGAQAQQPYACRGCGAMVALPNPKSPKVVDSYPGIAGAPLTNAARLTSGNPSGAALSEV